jgi:activator of HSP90 ATPase
MSKTILQDVSFPVRASRLYALYADNKLHSAATGQKATVGKAAGGRFAAFNGMITGKLLYLKKNRTIVQTWRGSHWKSSDPDSVLVLRFLDTPKGGMVKLVHANVPDHDLKGVTAGWHQFYWRPWLKFLTLGQATRTKTRKGSGRRSAARRKPARGKR